MGGLKAVNYFAAIVSWHVCKTHRWVDVVHLFVLGYGVVDPFLNCQDMLLVAEVPRGLPRNLNPPRGRQCTQVHPCGRLETHIQTLASGQN